MTLITDSAEPLHLSLGLRPFPGLAGPEKAGATAHDRMVAALRDVRALGLELGEADPYADFEDFWEDALRAAAIYRALTASGTPWVLHAPGQPWTPEQLGRRLGPVLVREELRHSHDALLDHPALLERSGRWIARATYYDSHDEGADRADSTPPDDDLVSILCARARETGERHVVLKQAATKAGIVRLRIHPEREAMRNELFGNPDLGWSLVRLADRPRAFLVSQLVPMTYEYRTFVVDGRVVTAAGCIEEFTPLDNTSRFDPRMRRARANGVAFDIDERSPIETNHQLAGDYVAFAQEIAAGLPEGQRTVVIDLAFDPHDNTIRVVELNSMPNSGLYACDVDALHHALAAAADRGYWPYTFLSTALEDMAAQQASPAVHACSE